VPPELQGAMAYNGDGPAVDDPIEANGKQIGKVVSSKGGVGLAMVRLEHMLGKEGALEAVQIGGRKGAVVLPLWYAAVQDQASEQQSVQA